MQRVATQLGYGVESVRPWVHQADIDDGVTPGTSTVEAKRIKDLEQTPPTPKTPSRPTIQHQPRPITIKPSPIDHRRHARPTTENATEPFVGQTPGSLVTNQVRAYDLLRMFGRDGRPTPLGQAFIEYGRIAKTLHLLELVDPIDGTYQRRMNRQLTVQESRHRLARKICHGNRGQIRQPYREGQEDQLAALGLVLNAVVLWNTRYLNAIIREPARQRPTGPRGRRRPAFATRARPPQLPRPLRIHHPAAGTTAPLRDPDSDDSEDDEF